MNKLLIYSLLVAFAQIPVLAESKTTGEHAASRSDSSKIIESWSSNRSAAEGFEAALVAIKRSLEQEDSLDSKKIDFLSDWVAKLLNGQNALLNRATNWLQEAPSTLSKESRERLVNQSTLYLERIKRLEKLQADIREQAKLRKRFDDLQQQNEKNQIEIMQEDLEKKEEKLKKALEDQKKTILNDLKWA